MVSVSVSVGYLINIGREKLKWSEQLWVWREIYVQIAALHLKLYNEEHLLSGFWVGEPFVGLPVSQCREEEEALINRRSLQHTHTHT